MQPTQSSPLKPGTCEHCRKPLDSERFSFWSDFRKKTRSCQHIVCGPCRDVMTQFGSDKKHCPKRDCGKPFNSIQLAFSPSTANVDEFFKFVNYTETGRITKDELAAWYTTNFHMTFGDAMTTIDHNWKFWDVPKVVQFLGWKWSTDQGDLDKDEFLLVQKFMKNDLDKSLTSEPRGKKRSTSGGDDLLEAQHFLVFVEAQHLRNLAKKKRDQSEELQQKLSNTNDKGREWFDLFDEDRNGKLSKEELINAQLQTLIGSLNITHEQVTSLVDRIWGAIDRDGDGSINFDEFQDFREAFVEQLRQ